MKLPKPFGPYGERRRQNRILKDLEADLYGDHMNSGPEDLSDGEYSAVRAKAALRQIERNKISPPTLERKGSAAWLRQNKLAVMAVSGAVAIVAVMGTAEMLGDQYAESRINAEKERGSALPGSPAHQAAMQQAMFDKKALRVLRVCPAELYAEAAWQYSLISQPPINEPHYKPEITRNPAFLNSAAQNAAEAKVPCTASPVYTVPESYQTTINDIQLTLTPKTFSSFSADTVCKDRDQLQQTLDIAPQAHDYELESRRIAFMGTFIQQAGVQCPAPSVAD